MSEENKSNLKNQGQSNGADSMQNQAGGLQNQLAGTQATAGVNAGTSNSMGQGRGLDAVAVHKDDSNSQEISQIKLSDGSVVSREQAVQLAEEHKVNLVAAKSRSGEGYVRNYPDGDPSNNLKNLPEF